MRTPDRHEFLCDVVVGFVEGRPYDWFKVRNYRWWYPDLSGGTAEHEPGRANAYADLNYENHETDTPPWLGWRKLDVDLVEAGCLRLLAGPIEGLHEETRARLIGAYAVNDAGLLDINDYDVIIQAAVYDAIIFG